jgi:hypothetical protein
MRRAPRSLVRLSCFVYAFALLLRRVTFPLVFLTTRTVSPAPPPHAAEVYHPLETELEDSGNPRVG